MGRPSNFKHRGVITTYNEDDTIKELKEIARREGTSTQEIMRKLMDDYVKNHKEGNSQMLLTSSIEDPAFQAFPTIGEMLRPERLDKMAVDDLHELRRTLGFRSQEVEAAYKRKTDLPRA